MPYVVTAPMVLCDRTDGSVASVLRGGALPDDAAPDHVEHLVSLGLVKREGHAIAGLLPSYVGDGSRLLEEPGVHLVFAQAVDDEAHGQADGEADETNDDPVEGQDGLAVPARVARKADWVAYAVARGADEAEVEGMTKEQLVETYGG